VCSIVSKKKNTEAGDRSMLPCFILNRDVGDAIQLSDASVG
jgi:hypothetical protein